MKVFKPTTESKGKTNFLDPFMGIDIATKRRKSSQRYLNWDKVREIIDQNPNSTIEAGLLEDWNNTGDTIYADGEIIDCFDIYDNSNWATPVVIIDGEIFECYSDEPCEKISTL